MSRVPRIVVRVGLGLAVLLALGLLAVVALLDPAAHKARIEQTASRVLGMEVHVNGPMSLRWRPQPHLVLRDVHARKHGADIVVAQEAVIGFEALSLFGRAWRVRSVALHDGVFAMVRERDGRFNFLKDPEPGPRPERAGPDISFERATISYTDPRFDKGIEGHACRGSIRGVHLAGGDQRLLTRLSFEGEATCADVRAGDVVLTEVSTTATGKQGVIDFQPLTTKWLDAQSSGHLRADFSGPVPAYQLEQTLQQFSVEQLLKALSQKEIASGRMNLALKLAMQGKALKDLRQSMQGTLSLRGQGLTYHGVDLDAQFERFESTQNLSLFDVGAMFLAGPAGLLVTKGYDFVNAAQGAQGKSEIRTLVSDWSVERGVARTRDVAMATAANRVALKGGIDLVNDRLQDMTIALVDAKGCAKVKQQVRGTLQKPQVEKPNPVEAVTGPAVRLIKKGAELISGDSCEVFYAGAVPGPSPK